MCAFCGSTFLICKSCFRGQRYCSDECRVSGYKIVQKRARQKHEKSVEARLDHRDRQKRYREKQKNVTDQSSNRTKNLIKDLNIILIPEKQFEFICIICKRSLFVTVGDVYV